MSNIDSPQSPINNKTSRISSQEDNDIVSPKKEKK